MSTTDISFETPCLDAWEPIIDSQSPWYYDAFEVRHEHGFKGLRTLFSAKILVGDERFRRVIRADGKEFLCLLHPEDLIYARSGNAHRCRFWTATNRQNGIAAWFDHEGSLRIRRGKTGTVHTKCLVPAAGASIGYDT